MTEIDRFFYSLMDQSRLRCLLLLLGEEEISAGDMTQALGLVQSKVSWHLAALRAEGLVLDHREAKRVYEPITPIRPPQSVNLGMVGLGKKLYFDPRLSNSGFISCNSCHNLSMGGTDNIKTSIGDKWQQGPINADSGCVACHNGEAVGGNSFQKMGVVEPYKGAEGMEGRPAVTGKDADRFNFKGPTLRNVALTYPYFRGPDFPRTPSVRVRGYRWR